MGAKVDERSAVEIDFLDVTEAMAYVQDSEEVSVTLQFSTERAPGKYVVLFSLIADGLRDSLLGGSSISVIGQVERQRLYELSREVHTGVYRLAEELSSSKVEIIGRLVDGEENPTCQVCIDLTGGTIIK